MFTNDTLVALTLNRQICVVVIVVDDDDVVVVFVVLLLKVIDVFAECSLSNQCHGSLAEMT